jgi:hypothetical protein
MAGSGVKCDDIIAIDRPGQGETFDPGFEFLVRDAAFNGKALVAKVKHRDMRPRQFHLGSGDRLIELIAETILDERDQVALSTFIETEENLTQYRVDITGSEDQQT